MNLYHNEIFHIYNRGNNKQRLFFSDANYEYFLRKVKKHLMLYCDILAWCLMPNHFHFMIFIKEEEHVKLLSNGFQILLSSYTRAINRQESRVGSLFTQNSKSKPLTGAIGTNLYPTYCFNYIHFNPVAAGLTSEMKDWPYSSYRDYFEGRGGKLVNQSLAKGFIDFEIPEVPEEGMLKKIL